MKRFTALVRYISNDLINNKRYKEPKDEFEERRVEHEGQRPIDVVEVSVDPFETITLRRCERGEHSRGVGAAVA